VQSGDTCQSGLPRACRRTDRLRLPWTQVARRPEQLQGRRARPGGHAGQRHQHRLRQHRRAACQGKRAAAGWQDWAPALHRSTTTCRTVEWQTCGSRAACRLPLQVALLEALQALAKREAVRRHVQRKTSRYFSEQLAEVGKAEPKPCLTPYRAACCAQEAWRLILCCLPACLPFRSTPSRSSSTTCAARPHRIQCCPDTRARPGRRAGPLFLLVRTTPVGAGASEAARGVALSRLACRRFAVALLKRLQQTQSVLLAMRHMLPAVPEADEAIVACEVRPAAQLQLPSAGAADSDDTEPGLCAARHARSLRPALLPAAGDAQRHRAVHQQHARRVVQQRGRHPLAPPAGQPAAAGQGRG
jgi:hypothetical protein